MNRKLALICTGATAVVFLLAASCGSPSVTSDDADRAGQEAAADQTPAGDEADSDQTPARATSHSDPDADAPAVARPEAARHALSPAPVYAEFGPSSAGVSTPTLYPLGWSPQGTFGYVEIREDPGRGGFSAHLRIVDLVTDEPIVDLEELDWDHDGIVELGVPDDTDRIAAYFLDVWSAPIAETGLDPLEPGHQSAFLPLPVDRQDVSYYAEFDVVYGGEDPAFDTIEAYDFWLRGDDGTKKLVTSREPRAVGVTASGYFHSPFEPRVAIVLIEERYTFEGTEPVAVLTGSNMAVGFELAR